MSRCPPCSGLKTLLLRNTRWSPSFKAGWLRSTATPFCTSLIPTPATAPLTGMLTWPEASTIALPSTRPWTSTTCTVAPGVPRAVTTLPSTRTAPCWTTGELPAVAPVVKVGPATPLTTNSKVWPAGAGLPRMTAAGPVAGTLPPPRTWPPALRSTTVTVWPAVPLKLSTVAPPSTGTALGVMAVTPAGPALWPPPAGPVDEPLWACTLSPGAMLTEALKLKVPLPATVAGPATCTPLSVM